MTKVEFIAALRAKLSMLPADAREDAVQFYEEYFDEAGPENEQAVIAELGSPDAVAEKILSGEVRSSSVAGRMAARLTNSPLPASLSKKVEMCCRGSCSLSSLLRSGEWH